MKCKETPTIGARTSTSALVGCANDEACGEWGRPWANGNRPGAELEFRAPMARVLLAVAMLVFLAGAATARAAESSELSPNFTLDTILRPPHLGGTAAASSSLFAVDTRPYLGPFFGEPSANSGLFTVNTRSGSGSTTALLAGRILANGQPVADARVSIEGTSLWGLTFNDGTFAIYNVPLGSGYVVLVSANGFGTLRITDVNVTGGTVDLGARSLTTVSGSFQVRALLPDVNPLETTVQEDGVAYRYYQVLDAATGQPVGGVPVSLRRRGSALEIPQSGDTTKNWAGFEAGLSDGDGIVRLRLPASAIGAANQAATFEVVQAGQVRQTFVAWVDTKEYEQSWSHSVGGGVRGKVAGLKVAGEGALEAEVTQTIRGGIPISETITRSRRAEISAGVSIGGAARVGKGPKTEAKVEGYADLSGYSSYSFSPTTTSVKDNAMKLYVTLGDPLAYGASAASGPLGFGILELARDRFEAIFLNSSLEAAGGQIRLGGRASADADLGIGKLSKNIGLEARAELSGQVEGIIGFARTYGHSPENGFTLGVAASGNASFGLGADFGKDNFLGLSAFAGIDKEITGTLWLSDASKPLRLELAQETQMDAGLQVDLELWDRYNPGLAPAGYTVKRREEFSFLFPNEGAFSKLNLAAPIWGALKQGGQGSVIGIKQPTALAGSVLQLAFNENAPLEYWQYTYLGKPKSFEFDVDLDPFVAGLGVTVQGGVESGAEILNEQGRIWRYKRMALASYPPITTDLVPTDTILDKERQWAANATSFIAEAAKKIVKRLEETGRTVVDAGKAALEITGNALVQGTTVVVIYIERRFQSGGLARSASLRFEPGQHANFLPDYGQTNFIYGIGGIYHFTSTNQILEPITLAICYDEAEVTGLNEADLRVYWMPDGTNRWQLVGGTVDAVSNRVTVAITNWGTYAIAPPMPAGKLALEPSTPSLRADGVSQMTVTVTNLLLNNGLAATHQWLFTAAALGVEILNEDVETNLPGVQVVSTNAAITLKLRAPAGGTGASVELRSVAGDAFGWLAISLVDDSAPLAPTGLVLTGGQSRIGVAWQTNGEPDLAGFRVYYRAGSNGPPYDGTAAVEGSPSPVLVNTTNALLRGLLLGTNYYVAVSAVDVAGNEGPLSPAVSITLTQAPPAAPTGVAARFGTDGTNAVMWTFSEDDGYNDRDVARYLIWRAVLPDGNYEQIGEVPAGVSGFMEPGLAVSPSNYVRYAVSAVDASGLSSPLAEANLQEYFVAPNTSVGTLPALALPQMGTNGQFQVLLSLLPGFNYSVQASTNLSQWVPVTSFFSTNGAAWLIDPAATNFASRFYRVTSP